MPLTRLHVENYRSIREIRLPLKRVNTIIGPNGVGKSNLYNSLALLRAMSEGTLARAFANEGGLPSALWAGRGTKPHIHIEIELDDIRYSVDITRIPATIQSMFQMDPQVKFERIEQVVGGKKITFMERGLTTCLLRDAKGEKQSYTAMLRSSETALSQVNDPYNFPYIAALRSKIQAWRLYHTFRTDSDSHLRRAQVGTRTYSLAPDGSDIAAALQTIRENGADNLLEEAIADAFPGSQLVILGDCAALEVGLLKQEMSRPLIAKELSDGTLRYLGLVAALLSPAPAPLIALNEPENSLYPEMMGPLARLLARAAEQSQIWLTTHSDRLASELSELTSTTPIRLEMVDGATNRVGRPPKAAFSADWDL